MPRLKKDYIAVLLGAFLVTMTSSGASYISTREAVSTQDVRVTHLEEVSVQNILIHKDINNTLKAMNDNNKQVEIALTRLATIIELKVLEDKGD